MSGTLCSNARAARGNGDADCTLAGATGASATLRTGAAASSPLAVAMTSAAVPARRPNPNFAPPRVPELGLMPLLDAPFIEARPK